MLEFEGLRAFFYHPLVYPLYLSALLEIAIVVLTVRAAKVDGIYDPTRLPDAIGKYLGPWLGLCVLAFLVYLVGEDGQIINVETGVLGVAYAGAYTTSIRRDLAKIVSLFKGQPELRMPIDSPVIP